MTKQKTKNQRFLARSPRTSNETGNFLTSSPKRGRIEGNLTW